MKWKASHLKKYQNETFDFSKLFSVFPVKIIWLIQYKFERNFSNPKSAFLCVFHPTLIAAFISERCLFHFPYYVMHFVCLFFVPSSVWRNLNNKLVKEKLSSCYLIFNPRFCLCTWWLGNYVFKTIMETHLLICQQAVHL